MSVPGESVVTTPDADIVARLVFVLLQVPPVVELVMASVTPGHAALLPTMLAIAPGTETTSVMAATPEPQLFVTVYLIDELPPETPVATPPEVIVATEVAVLLHVPPVAPLAE